MAPPRILEAFHILAADINDEIHVGVEMAGGAVVGHRLHQPRSMWNALLTRSSP